MRRRPGSTEPCHHEQGRARQARDEHHDAVDDGGGDAPVGAQAGRGERPCRSRPRAAPSRRCSAAPWRASRAAPAAASGTVGAATPAVRAAIRNVAAWPTTTTAEASAIAGQRVRARAVRRGCRRPRRSGSAPGASDRRQVAARASEHDAERSRDEQRSRSAAWTSARATAGRGARRRSARPARPARRQRSHDDGAQPAADVVHVATVADAAVDVADDAAGQRQVEEQRAVVRRDGGGQRQVDAEAAGDDLPPPGAAERWSRRRCPPPRPERRPSTRADAVEERAGAEAPDHDGERRARRERRASGRSAQVIAADGRLTAAPAGRRGRR